DAGAPAMVLLVERAGDLDIVMLDGDGRDVVPQVRLRLARSGATSAALLVDAPMTPDGATHDGFWILGEGIDGTTARRRYRVRPCGRVRTRQRRRRCSARSSPSTLHPATWSAPRAQPR